MQVCSRKGFHLLPIVRTDESLIGLFILLCRCFLLLHEYGIATSIALLIYNKYRVNLRNCCFYRLYWHKSLPQKQWCHICFTKVDSPGITIEPSPTSIFSSANNTNNTDGQFLPFICLSCDCRWIDSWKCLGVVCQRHSILELTSTCRCKCNQSRTAKQRDWLLYPLTSRQTDEHLLSNSYQYLVLNTENTRHIFNIVLIA